MDNTRLCNFFSGLFVLYKHNDKKERNIAKAMLFKILYGGSEFTIAQDLGVSIEEASLFFNAFFDANEGLLDNFKVTKDTAMKRGWIEIDQFTKKRYFFKDYELMNQLSEKAWSYYPENYKKLSMQERAAVKAQLKVDSPELADIWSKFMTLKGKLERAALNYRIQGTSATMTKIAALLLDEENMSLSEGLLLLVHDELVEEYANTKDLEALSQITVSKMKQAGGITCKTVPMNAETAVGTFWIH